MQRGRMYEKQDMEKHSKSDRGNKINVLDSYTPQDIERKRIVLVIIEYNYHIGTMTYEINVNVNKKRTKNLNEHET